MCLPFHHGAKYFQKLKTILFLHFLKVFYHNLLLIGTTKIETKLIDENIKTINEKINPLKENDNNINPLKDNDNNMNILKEHNSSSKSSSSSEESSSSSKTIKISKRNKAP